MSGHGPHCPPDPDSQSRLAYLTDHTNSYSISFQLLLYMIETVMKF